MFSELKSAAIIVTESLVGHGLSHLTDAVEKCPAANRLLWGTFSAAAGLASRPGRQTPRPNCHATYAIDAHN
jgi:hypothetical protein